VSDLHCPARIIVARHGETEYETPEMNATGGSLTLRGREQARELGERLRGERVAAVVSSDLSRAVQTAEIAAAVLGLPVRVRERMYEYPAGDYLGHPYDHAFFDPLVRGWLAGDLDAGVPGGETGRETADRVLGVLDDVADQHRGETVLAITHGGVILALWGAIAPGSSLAPRSDGVANGAAYVFERDADGWRVGTPLQRS
jgi:broad specificity phosphatase PhoE